MKSVLLRAAKRLSYTEDARCLKVNLSGLYVQTHASVSLCPTCKKRRTIMYTHSSPKFPQRCSLVLFLWPVTPCHCVVNSDYTMIQRHVTQQQSSQHRPTFLGTFAKLPNATVSSVMSVFPSVQLHGSARLPQEGFSSNFVYDYFW